MKKISLGTEKIGVILRAYKEKIEHAYVYYYDKHDENPTLLWKLPYKKEE